jgi:hypothetical protein
MATAPHTSGGSINVFGFFLFEMSLLPEQKNNKKLSFRRTLSLLLRSRSCWELSLLGLSFFQKEYLTRRKLFFSSQLAN